jgi:hypothetical protein
MWSKSNRSMIHGTANAYDNECCRCAECRAGNTKRCAAERVMRAARLTADPGAAEHGNYSTYVNYSCRCPDCREANAARGRDYYNARKAAS